MLFFGVFLRESASTAAKSRTNLSTNSGKATKQLGRLAPNLAHMCKFIWEWIYAKQIALRDTRGALGVLGGQTFKSLEKLSNGWTDWHQLWFTSADSSGNGHRLNTSRPSIPQGLWGGVGGHKFKSLGKLSNGCADWHRISYTSADSSGNGHRLNTIRPSIPQGVIGGGGHKFKSLGKQSNNWTDWHQIWYTSADSSGSGHRLNTIRPTIPQGHFGFLRGSQIKMFGKAVKRLDRLAPNLVQICGFVWEWTWAKYNSPLNTPRGFRGVTNSKVLVSCQTTGLFGTKFSTRLRIRLEVDIG